MQIRGKIISMEKSDRLHSHETVDYGPKFRVVADYMLDREDIISYLEAEKYSPNDVAGIDFYVSRQDYANIPLQIVSDGKNRREHIKKLKRSNRNPDDFIFVQMVDQRKLRPVETVADELVDKLNQWVKSHTKS